MLDISSHSVLFSLGMESVWLDELGRVSRLLLQAQQALPMILHRNTGLVGVRMKLEVRTFRDGSVRTELVSHPDAGSWQPGLVYEGLGNGRPMAAPGSWLVGRRTGPSGSSDV
jgi:hypothetical protein